MLDYGVLFTILFFACLLLIFILYCSSIQIEPKSRKVRNLGHKFKVVTGPQFCELLLTKEKKMELQELVENTGTEIHDFIADANHFYFVIKHVFGYEPQPFIFCSKASKKAITSEMTHNSSIESDFVKVPLEFNQLYRFLSNL